MIRDYLPRILLTIEVLAAFSFPAFLWTIGSIILIPMSIGMLIDEPLISGITLIAWIAGGALGLIAAFQLWSLAINRNYKAYSSTILLLFSISGLAAWLPVVFMFWNKGLLMVLLLLAPYFVAMHLLYLHFFKKCI